MHDRTVLVTIAFFALAGTAAADTLTGEVVAAHGRRTAGGIVTDARIRLDDGREQVVTQIGGHADGLTMYVWHGPPPLEPGLRVWVDAHRELSAWQVDDVEVLAGVGGVPYVRTPAKKSGKPLYWAKSCVQLWRANEGTTAIAGEDEAAVIQRSVDTWNTGIAGCAYMNVDLRGAVAREVGEDQINLIKFRDQTWCRPVPGGGTKCHSPSAAGITTVVYVDDPTDPRDGEIVDADIELNGVDFAISINGQSLSTAFCKADLANTLVHELGHLLGLDHTCRKSGEAIRYDQNGEVVPLCSSTSSATITEATMYPEQDCGETKKATLSSDDTSAMCAIYASSGDPGECGPPDELQSGCCSTGDRGGPSRTTAALALLVLLGVLRRRRAGPRST